MTTRPSVDFWMTSLRKFKLGGFEGVKDNTVNPF